MSRFGLINGKVQFWFDVQNQKTPFEMASVLRAKFWDLVPEIFAETGSSGAVGTITMEIRQLAKLIEKSTTNQQAREIIKSYRELNHA